MPPKIYRQAYERTDAGTEYLIRLVKDVSRPLQIGDTLPLIIGTHFNSQTGVVEPFSVASIPGVRVLSFVNMHETEICDIQTGIMEQFQREHPELTVISFSKQDPEKELAKVTATQDLSHPLVAIDDATAEELGVGLRPYEGASEAWNNMLLRAMIVVDTDNKIVHIEYVMNQMDHPNYEAAQSAALAALPSAA